MKHPDPKLLTPIYIKTEEDMPWPQDEKAFYLLTANELYLCRNHRFFTSCVPAPRWPSELAFQKQFLKLRYPKIPRRLLEMVIGFFDHIATRHGSEAAALLVWDDNEDCMRVVVPPQVATVSTGWSGKAYPMDVHYQIPKLPQHLTLLGDVHSHAEMSAYASYTDKHDETHSAGLHIVVGRIDEEPPQFHIDAVVDGVRFRVEDPAMVFAGYRRRCPDFPQTWVEKVKVMPWNEYKKQCETSCFDGGTGSRDSKLAALDAQATPIETGQTK